MGQKKETGGRCSSFENVKSMTYDLGMEGTNRRRIFGT